MKRAARLFGQLGIAACVVAILIALLGLSGVLAAGWMVVGICACLLCFVAFAIGIWLDYHS